ncbi:hypothetical protein Trydic_g4182 [Trypoxylus dichotomus]
MALSLKNSEVREDLVAYWSIPLRDGMHTVEFEHGPTSGKRVLRIDGQEVIRREWMFKLVGDEKFTIGIENIPCELCVDPMPNLAFEYNLYVNGKPFEKFVEEQNRSLRLWSILLNGKRHKIVLEKETLDIWVNGENMEIESDFTDTGTEMVFMLDENEARLRACSAKKKEGVLHELYINNKLVEDERL